MTRTTPGGIRGGNDMHNLVGDRTLVALQTVNISRLSTHPLPITPGTLIVVAGAGPKDSNGAGKSSFIAAITALLGDEQWRFATGAKALTELLFNAELAAQGDTQWASADHGYIVGIFTDPNAVDSSTLEKSALTVWLRVNQDAPHLQVRWAEGVRLATASSEAGRVEQAGSLWEGLPRSAGRKDVVARDLGRVLYGDRVRCVSFLSTSVRSKVATNLLSQPLNEISAERIFDAIAALTGLDRELEQEREARRDEYDKRATAIDAHERLSAWEQDVAVLLATFERRDRARTRLDDAWRHWRTRQARLLVDALALDEELEKQLQQRRQEAEEEAEAAEALREDIRKLADDSLDAQLSAGTSHLEELQAQAKDLAEQRAVTNNRLDERRAQVPALQERQRDADGRDEPTVLRELAATKEELGNSQQELGVARKELGQTKGELSAAESGHGTARQQIAALSEAGIPACGLVDGIELSEEVRDRWEGALWPYLDAVVVSSTDLPSTITVLAELPGSIIVPADGPLDDDADTTVASSLPVGVHSTLPIGRFLAAVNERLDHADQPEHSSDRATGAVIVGGFADPITGREARVRAARARVDECRTRVKEIEGVVGSAQDAVAQAERRLEGAQAAGRLQEIHGEIEGLREELGRITTAEDQLTPALTEARQRAEDLRVRVHTRQLQVSQLEGRRDARDRARDQAREQAGLCASRRDDLRLDQLREQWAEAETSAHEWLHGLAESERAQTADDWARDAETSIGEALRGVFPEGRDDPDMPEQIQFLLRERQQPGAGRTHREQETFPQLAEALASYLRSQQEYEHHQRTQVEIQRQRRNSDLGAARKGAEEAAQSASVHRSALTSAIRDKLQRVADAFERIDFSYGGYGASLDFPTPEPPSDPEQPWRWRVIPKWRRAEGQSPVPYNRRGNTALMDEKAVKLVCAAALASSGGGSLCLVLDELGRNLGHEHRREAVDLFRQIGESHGITVLGALQDDMESYAIDACGQYIKLRRSSDAHPYNEPPVAIGHDEHAERVRLLASWVTTPRTPQVSAKSCGGSDPENSSP